MCSIRWFKNEEELQKDADLFLIEETIVLEDPETNTFSSVMSSLSWNLEVLPEKRVDHDELNLTISCTVDENEIGQGISSSSQITVECEFPLSVRQMCTKNFFYQMRQKMLRYLLLL